MGQRQQQQVLAAIERLYKETGSPVTRETIAKEMGYSPTSWRISVTNNVKPLEASGAVRVVTLHRGKRGAWLKAYVPVARKCTHSTLRVIVFVAVGKTAIVCCNCDKTWEHVSGAVYQANGAESEGVVEERRQDSLPAGA